MELQQAHVLVIDDNAKARAIVATALGAVVSAVHEAADAISGLAKWLETRPHLVLVDYHMPDLAGPTFISILRAQEAVLNTRTAVLMITAVTDRDHVLAARHDGADGYVVKPLQTDSILGRAVQVLSPLPAGAASPQRWI